jgi:hypothetical protein
MILNPLSGFGRSRRLYRVLGTVLGAIFGIVVRLNPTELGCSDLALDH